MFSHNLACLAHIYKAQSCDHNRQIGLLMIVQQDNKIKKKVASYVKCSKTEEEYNQHSF